VHHGERNCTSTLSKLSKTGSVSAPHPWLCAISRKRIAVLHDTSRVFAYPENSTLHPPSITGRPAVGAYGARRPAVGQTSVPASAPHGRRRQCAARLRVARPERPGVAGCYTLAPPSRSRPEASGIQKTRRWSGGEIPVTGTAMITLTTSDVVSSAFRRGMVTGRARAYGCHCTEHQGSSQTPSWPRLRSASALPI
jgi:hypothetical protein